MNRGRVAVSIFIILVMTLVNGRIVNVREQIPDKFQLLARTESNHLHEFRLALKQKNIDILESTLLEVANPDSKHYGKWWTRGQILDLIAPSETEVEPVVAWLKSFEVNQIDVSGDFIKVVAAIQVIERMFDAEFYNFKSTETGKIVVRVFGEVHVPDHLSIIDMVTGLTELVPQSAIGRSLRRSTTKNARNKRKITQDDPLGVIYPGILRIMYDIPAEYPVHPMSSLCLVEFQNDASYSPDDLQAFNREMFESVSVSQNIGPYTPNPPDGESTLDVQYGGAIALNTTLWFWTVDSWMYEFATQIFDAQPYPLVVSMSWGWPEESQCEVVGCPINSTIYSYDYVKKVNVEFAKLGLMGITLLAASGDQGAPGDDNTLCTTNQISNLFPGSSPWVTSVGATMLVYTHAPRNLTYTQPPLCTQYYCARTKVEGVCTYPNALITSGGGFSNVTALPDWQKQAVLKYLNSGVTLPTGQFDPTKRAYPDVAANGHNYIIHFTGEETPVDGTSASTPVFGGIIALLNSFMFNNKKQQLGFINPLLYKMSFDDATIFTDITTGNNFCTEQCCTTTGFVATKEWDAVTGLGTPVFSKMQAYIQKVLIKAK